MQVFLVAKYLDEFFDDKRCNKSSSTQRVLLAGQCRVTKQELLRSSHGGGLDEIRLDGESFRDILILNESFDDNNNDNDLEEKLIFTIQNIKSLYLNIIGVNRKKLQFI